MRILLCSLLLAVACDGVISDGSSPGDEMSVDRPSDPPTSDACAVELPDDPVCEAGPHVVERPWALLSARQYEAAVRDILEDDTLEADLPSEMGTNMTLAVAEELNGFVRNAVANYAFPEGAITDEYALEILEGIATRAYRRPLTDAERERLAMRYQDNLDPELFYEMRKVAVRIVMESILQSPQMLYVVINGEAVDDTDLRRLSGRELAVRLSLFLWGEPGTPEWLDSVQDRLADEAAVRVLAREMLDDPRARPQVVSMVAQWLGVEMGTRTAPSVYEDFDALKASATREMEMLIERVVFDGAGTIEELFTTTDSYVDGRLAEIYGVDVPAGGAGWVELEGRAGALTRVAYLATHTQSDRFHSPIRRGAHIIRHLLCEPLDEPPPTVDDTPPGGSAVDGEVQTIRDVVHEQTHRGSCGCCHNRINPAGFALEDFDRIGRHRDTEAVTLEDGSVEQVAIDASGQTSALTPGLSEVRGGVELSVQLAGHSAVHSCFAKKAYDDVLGFSEDPAHACSRQQAIDTARESGGDVRAIVAAIAAHAAADR